MVCPDCNGSKTYTPLVGPIEDCKACGGSGVAKQADASGLQSSELPVSVDDTGDFAQWVVVEEDADSTETRGSCEPLYCFTRTSLAEPLPEGHKAERKAASERSWQMVPASTLLWNDGPSNTLGWMNIKREVMSVASAIVMERLATRKRVSIFMEDHRMLLTVCVSCSDKNNNVFEFATSFSRDSLEASADIGAMLRVELEKSLDEIGF